MKRFLIALAIVLGLGFSTVIMAKGRFEVQNPGHPNVVILVGGTETIYFVRSEMNCWTTRLAGRVGNFGGRIVIKFTQPQLIKLRYAECEENPEVSAQARAFWASIFFNFQYRWEVVRNNQQIIRPSVTPLQGGWYYEEFNFPDGSMGEDDERAYLVPKASLCVTDIESGRVDGRDLRRAIFVTLRDTNVVLYNVYCIKWQDNLVLKMSAQQMKSELSTRYGGTYNNSTVRYMDRTGNFVSATRTPTASRTPTIGSSMKIPSGVTALHIPRAGHICWGEKVGNYSNALVEYTRNEGRSIQIVNGGCETTGNYTAWQILKHLESKGIKYKSYEFPMIPTITNTPTVTIVAKLSHDWSGGKATWLIPVNGSVCWGTQIGPHVLKVVEFTKQINHALLFKDAFCVQNTVHSRDDVFNHLKRTGKRVEGAVYYP
jgi:hypothetical protein